MSKSLPIHAAYQNLLSKGRLTTNPGQAALVNRLARLQETLNERTTSTNTRPQGPRSNGIYIYGDVGTGKSRIADLFAATLASNISRRRIHFYEFMMDIHTRLHQARSRSGYSGDPLVKIGREIHNESSVLCFDEFQVNDIADAMILKRLFGAIWDSGGIVVSTSNRHPTRLYENGLNRPLFIPFIEELQRRCEVWQMEGSKDYRMSSVQQQQNDRVCFFTNPDDFNTSLQKATNGVPLTPTIIPVMMNRKLLVQAIPLQPQLQQSSQTQTQPQPQPQNPSTTKTIVQATFASLCEKTLGSTDYHALCTAAHTIYLSGLRQFASDELDFIRRFITLIDIAYESRVRVICLSDVPVDEVFRNVVLVAASDETRTPIKDKIISVMGKGGSSSSMMSTFMGDGVEWSATGLIKASLASGGAGETDVRFAVGRTLSRLYEMNSVGYGSVD